MSKRLIYIFILFHVIIIISAKLLPKNNQQVANNTPVQPKEVAQIITTDGWQTIANNKFGFSFRYPISDYYYHFIEDSSFTISSDDLTKPGPTLYINWEFDDSINNEKEYIQKNCISPSCIKSFNTIPIGGRDYVTYSIKLKDQTGYGYVTKLVNGMYLEYYDVDFPPETRQGIMQSLSVGVQKTQTYHYEDNLISLDYPAGWSLGYFGDKDLPNNASLSRGDNSISIYLDSLTFNSEKDTLGQISDINRYKISSRAWYPDTKIGTSGVRYKIISSKQGYSYNWYVSELSPTIEWIYIPLEDNELIVIEIVGNDKVVLNKILSSLKLKI